MRQNHLIRLQPGGQNIKRYGTRSGDSRYEGAGRRSCKEIPRRAGFYEGIVKHSEARLAVEKLEDEEQFESE